MFYYSDDNKKMDEKMLQSGQKEISIACCSYTENGKIKPIFFKMPDDNGIIQTYYIKHINYAENKMYKGQRVIDFQCRIDVNGLSVLVNLIAFVDSCKWVLIQCT